MIDLLITTLGNATPLLFAVYGGLWSELSGVINFALEGMMLAGAFGSVWGSYVSGSPWLGLVLGALSGLVVGCLHATASLIFRANQIVSSIALNILAAGATGMLLHQLFHVYGTSPAVASLTTFSLRPFLAPLTGADGAATSLRISIMTPMALAIALASVVFFQWHRWGWHVRACGENPSAARASGLSVGLIRFTAVAVAGLLAGMGGAAMAIGQLSQFVENMTGGRGYLAIVALILGRWRPRGVFWAALLFAFGEALAEQGAVRWSHFPYQLFLAVPYLICLVVLVIFPGRKQPPSALGKI